MTYEVYAALEVVGKQTFLIIISKTDVLFMDNY